MRILICFHSQFEVIEKYNFLECYEAVLPQLYLYHRGLTALHSTDDHFYTFNARDFQGDSVILGHKTLYLSKIREYVEKLIVKIQSDMNELLFCRPEFTLVPDSFIHDDPRLHTASWGFIHDKRNPWIPATTILEHILNNPALFAQFAYRNECGEVVWKPVPCHQYAKQIFENMMDTFIAIILTSGAPERGTELLSHLIRNVSGGSIRNVYVLFNEFILRGSYNKTVGATHSDKTMVHIPLPEVGKLMIRHLIFLRPIFCEFQQVFRPHMYDNVTHFLFAGFDRPIMTRDLSEKLSRVFGEEWEIPMSLGLYRQTMAFIFQCNNILFQQQDESVTADQMGHSKSMNHGHYGSDERFPLGLNDHLFQSTALLSAKYHLLLGFPPTLLKSITAGREKQTNILATVDAITQGHYVFPGQQVIQGQLGIMPRNAPAITVPGLAQAITEDLMPSISLSLNRAISQSVAAFANIAFPQLSPPVERVNRTVIRPPHPSLLPKFHQFLQLMGESRSHTNLLVVLETTMGVNLQNYIFCLFGQNRLSTKHISCWLTNSGLS